MPGFGHKAREPVIFSSLGRLRFGKKMMPVGGRSALHVGHTVSGTILIALGLAGLVRHWGALGLVARGALPFVAFAGGLIMLGAGARSLRQGEISDPRVARATPILAIAVCLLIMVAAVGGVQVELSGAWTPGRVVAYVALGFLSGIVGGMLGLGGGLVHLSGLTLVFGLPFTFARGATLINNVFINAAAALRYGRRGLLAPGIITLLLPTSLIGITGGSMLQAGFDEGLMRKIFATFVVAITVGIVVDTMNAQVRATTPEGADQGPVRHGLTGALAGLLSGVLGISGGVIAVPGQTLLSGVRLRQAIANSTLITAGSSALGTALLFVPVGGEAPSLEEMLTIAVLFVPGNVIGGHFGAAWMERLPVVMVRGFFVLALVAIAVRSWGIPT